MNYLVTGGTGFIGAYLVRYLVDAGHNVRVLDNDLRGSEARLKDIAEKIQLVKADIRDPDAVKKAAKGIGSIIHLAALNGTENFYQRPQLVLDIALRGMLSVMDAASKYGVREIILASSSEVYQTPPVIPTPEDVPLMIPDLWNPRYSYGGGKLASELILANYYKDAFERVIIFRPHNVYGPDMGEEHVLPQLIRRAGKLVKETPEGQIACEIQGDGTQTRAFIHVDDFVRGLALVLEKGQHRNVYHIGTSQEHKILDIVDMIFKYLGRDYKIVPGELPQGGPLRRCPDISKLLSLGFAPKIPLSEGIAGMVDWYLSH